MTKIKVAIGRDGTVRMVDSDAARDALRAMGADKPQLSRATNIETGRQLRAEAAAMVPPNVLADNQDSYFADITPVGGPVLGPFERRSEAVAAELQWLGEHGNPFPT